MGASAPTTQTNKERKGKVMNKECSQECGKKATCYGGGSYAGDWAGYYCDQCIKSLGYAVWDVFTEEIPTAL